MLAGGEALYGYVADGYWCDIGTIGEYMRANADLLNGRLAPAASWAHASDPTSGRMVTVEIAPDAQLIGPIFLGDEVKIKRGAIIHGPTVIRDYTVLDNHARVEPQHHLAQLLHRRGRRTARRHRGPAVQSQDRASMVFEGAVVGDSTVVGEDAIIQAGVKIWPNKEVENGATVKPQHHLGLPGHAACCSAATA